MSKEKIERLRERIRKLKEASKGEVLASYKEATQTQLTIEAYEKHLVNLESEHDDENDSELIKVILINEQQTKEFILVSSNPDPSKGIITTKSPLGEKLMKLEVGDKVSISEQEFTIHSKGPYNHSSNK